MKINYKEVLKSFFGHIKNTKVLAVIFIIGIGLMLIPAGNREKPQEQAEETTDFKGYKQTLEEDLQKILSQIKGAGKVSVMVTLVDGGDTYFAVDENASYTKGDTEEARNSQVTHVFKNDSKDGELPLVTKQTYPQISGVLICAEGANNPQVKNNIITAVEALLGVKSHRIEVMERK